MKHYAGMYKVEPGVRLRRRMRLSFSGSELGNPVVYVRDIVKKDEFGTEYESGIQFGVEVEATSIEEAYQRCGRISDAICSYLSFLTGVGLPVVEPIAVLQVETKPGEAQEYIQFYYPPLASCSYRNVAVDDMHNLLDALSACRKDWREKILRAIRWYRRCSQYNDVVDEFIASWIGLETLSPALGECLAVERRVKRCPHCNEKLPSGSQLEGLREFLIKEMPDGEQLFDSSYELRNKLLHGGGNIKKEIEIAKNLVLMLREATVKGICRLLELKPIKSIQTSILVPDVRTKMRLWAELFRIQDEQLEKNGEFPLFDLKVEKRKSSPGKAGRLVKENFTTVFEGPLSKKVKMSPKAKITIYGPDKILEDAKGYKRTDYEAMQGGRG